MAKGFAAWNAPEGIERIAGWALAGHDEARIAKEIGVTEATLRRWAGRSEAIARAIRKDVDGYIQVMRAIHRLACGYTRKVTKYHKVKGEKGEELVAVEEEVHVAPSVMAATYWAKNRRPRAWETEDMEQEQLSLLDALYEREEADEAKANAEAAGLLAGGDAAMEP